MEPFWKPRPGADECARVGSLCDGCGRCCLSSSKKGHRTKLLHRRRCTLLDGEACRCRDYPNRSAKVHDCVRLTARNIPKLNWLPPTCAYRLIGEGKDLAWWHPLVSGDPDTVHAAGISVRGRVAASENTVPDDRLEDQIVSWPRKWPKGARRKRPDRHLIARGAFASVAVAAPTRASDMRDQNNFDRGDRDRGEIAAVAPSSQLIWGLRTRRAHHPLAAEPMDAMSSGAIKVATGSEVPPHAVDLVRRRAQRS